MQHQCDLLESTSCCVKESKGFHVYIVADPVLVLNSLGLGFMVTPTHIEKQVRLISKAEFNLLRQKRRITAASISIQLNGAVREHVVAASCVQHQLFTASLFCLCVGSWSLQFECASKVCVLRSLLWLGLTFYHVPMTPQHGYVYMGDGTKNLDLPFML